MRSMTGFAAARREIEDVRVNVTVKAVNHRFLDVALKMPPALAPLESSVRSAVQARLARGRVEIAVSIDYLKVPAREVVVDEALLDHVVEAFAAARERGVVAGELTVSDALRLPQVVEIRAQTPEGEPGTVPPDVAELVEGAVGEALVALVAMRETEGGFLEADLSQRVNTIAGLVDALEAQSRSGQDDLEERLRERMAALPSELQADSTAVAQEIVRFVARSDVDEELVRLRGHVDHWRALAGGTEPCGRKLDFLVQEMNREINTIGSKIEGAHVTEQVIAAKAELERIREQVQNVE